MQANENTRLPASIAARIQGAREQVNRAGCSGAGVSYFDVDGGLYLKTDEPGRLAREATMQAYLHGNGFAPEVLVYETGARDFLLSRRARGETAIFPAYRAEPARLAAELGRAARRLHESAAGDCPIRGLSAEWQAMFARARAENRGLYAPVAAYLKIDRAEEACRYVDRHASLLCDDALIHGDFCLPNCMLEDFHFTAFIDAGGAGAGNRHFDLFWALWSLNRNLGCDDFRDAFLNAYGRADVDERLIRLSGCLCAFD